jgi:TctA family transporter
MTDPNYDIFKRDAFGARTWVEATRDLDAAKRRVIELSANSPGKYVVVSRASGQMVGGGTTIASGSASNSERNAQARKQESGTGSSRKVSSHAVPSPSDAESETLWR